MSTTFFDVLYVGKAAVNHTTCVSNVTCQCCVRVAQLSFNQMNFKTLVPTTIISKLMVQKCISA
jgi:hypothetical protein